VSGRPWGWLDLRHQLEEAASLALMYLSCEAGGVLRTSAGLTFHPWIESACLCEHSP
jgi:hypothetical protein